MINKIAPVEYDKYGRMKSHPVYHVNQGKVWNEEDINYLIEWYSKIGVKEMSLALGRTETTITTKVNRLRKQGMIF